MITKLRYEQAVERHGATVLRVCRAMLGAGPDADDAWSETFLAALHAWDELAESTNIEAWLVRVAHRKAVDVVRASARRATPVDDLPETQEPEQPDRSIWDVVAALPQRQREAIAYHYLGGLSHADTAAIVGSTAVAVRRAAADGMKTLRTRYLNSPNAKGESR